MYVSWLNPTNLFQPDPFLIRVMATWTNYLYIFAVGWENPLHSYYHRGDTNW